MIEAEGFEDRQGTYLTANVHTGVWLSDWPLDINEGPDGEAVLLLDLPEEVVANYEWAEDGKPYREFLVPATIVNRYPVVGRRDVFELKSELWSEH